MTEDQIERRVERHTDHLDRLFLAGQISQETYDKAMRDLCAWADAKHDRLAEPMTISREELDYQERDQ